MIFANYNPQSCIKMRRSLFVKPGNFFLQKFEKWQNVTFGLMYVMLRQFRVRASVQKSQGLRMVSSKKFSRDRFFVFWVTYLVDIYLSYLPVKQIWWQSAVWIRATKSFLIHIYQFDYQGNFSNSKWNLVFILNCTILAVAIYGQYILKILAIWWHHLLLLPPGPIFKLLN